MNKFEKITALAQKNKQTKLLKFCVSNEPEVRAAAATAMGTTKGDEGFNALINMLRDSEDVVRVASAKALGVMGSKNAMEHLRYFLNHANSSAELKAACKESMATLSALVH